MRCLTPKELLCGTKAEGMLGKCDPCQFNNLMSRVYTYFSGFDFLKDNIEFAGIGDITVKTTKDNIISQVLGIYVQADPGCCVSACRIPQDFCHNCDEDIYQIPHREVGKIFTDGDFTLDGGSVTLRINDKYKRGYLEYSRGPKIIDSFNDRICVKEQEITIIQTMANMIEAENKGNYDLAAYFERNLFNRRNRVREMEDTMLIRAKGSNAS